MSTAIVVNGEIRNPELIKSLLQGYTHIIAADGGANHCLKLGIRPNLIVGDLDSITPETLKAFAYVPTKQFPYEKDYTDLELAIQEVNAMERIALFCATGDRVDHSLTNLYILTRYPQRIFMESEVETISAFNRSLTVQTFPGQGLSILPIGAPAIGVTTKGLKWEMKKATLDHQFLSISNVCLGNQVEIDLDSGMLLLVLKR